MKRLGWLGGIGLFTALCWLGACNSPSEGGDTQTNWLKRCASNDECGGLECVCGRCAKSCSSELDCNGTPQPTRCHAAVSEAALALCGEGASASAACLVSCSVDAECASGQRCAGGACVPSSSGGADQVFDFCRRWVDALCDYTVSCGCGADSARTCHAQYASLCEPTGFFAGVASAVAAGSVTYDPAAGAALLARFSAPDPLCVEEPFRDLRLASDELYSWAGTFVGTLAPGTPCTLPGAACAALDAGGASCISLVGRGAACDASGDQNLDGTIARLCFDHRPPDSDGEYESAFDSLSCVLESATSTQRTCSSALSDGAPCDSAEACASGRCPATSPGPRFCAARLPDGAPCQAGNDCSSGSCDSSLTPAACGGAKADGQPCSFDQECLSAHCLGDAQGLGICGTGRAVGTTCAADSDCATEICRAGVCWADICGDYLAP